MSNPSMSVYSDFCQAWVSRFPHSDLPAAWEEDVRANLKKHKAKVAVLKEELEKEEMYVEYLDKLLGDIEAHRKLNPICDNGGGDVDALNSENKRRSASSADAVPENGESENNPVSASEEAPSARDRAQLRLDLADKNGGEDGGGAQQTEFVTVINVQAAAAKGSGGLCSKERPPEPSLSLSSFKKVPPRPPPKRTVSRDSLNSVSSPPVTPSSAHLLLLEEENDDLEGNPRESLLSPSSNSKDDGGGGLASTSRDSSEEQDENEEDFEFRGRPDGVEDQQKLPLQKRRPQLQQHPKVNKIKELMANWEGNPAGGSRPRSLQTTPHHDCKDPVRARASSLKTTSSSSSSSSDRVRMGSPSGKSHESSDGENNNWPAGVEQQQNQHPRVQKAQSQGGSPQRRRRMLPSTSGETRLDRLVRRPSGERASPGRHSEALPAPPQPPPPLPVPRLAKKPRAKPRSRVGSAGEELAEEPLYDTVANEEPEDEYDNHLLYGTNSTTKSGGSSSADLGFDEPKHHHHPNSLAKSAQSGLSGSGTLSSSETDKSASLKRGISLAEEEEEECNYVNIQYFLQAEAASSGGGGKQSNSSSSNMLDTIQSDEELDKEELSSSAEVFHEESESEASSASSEADRSLMYKSILNSIVDSEAAYLECLSVVLQYMKAMKVTLTTSQPVIPREEFDAIFFKIPELHDLHFAFHESLRKQVSTERWEGEGVGHTFKMLASRTKIYASFLANYGRALEALRRCSGAYPQFADLTRSIKLRSVKGQPQLSGQSLSLEDLLHRPVARIQKLSLGLQDLLRYAAAADRAPIGDALRQMRDFVGEYNSSATASSELLFNPQAAAAAAGQSSQGLNQASDLATQQLVQAQQQQRRHLVKNSFIVELHEGVRKLRHLFLFNDVLVCAKYKASSKRTEKFTFLLKWHIPLHHVSTIADFRRTSCTYSI